MCFATFLISHIKRKENLLAAPLRNVLFGVSTKCLQSNALKHSQNSGGLIDGNLYAKTIIHSTPFFVTVVDKKKRAAADLIIRGVDNCELKISAGLARFSPRALRESAELYLC